MMRYVNHGLAGLMIALIASFILTKAKLMNDQLFIPFVVIFILAGIFLAFISRNE